MAEPDRYRKSRLSSEQAESLRTNFTCPTSTRTPERRLTPTSRMSPAVHRGSTQPGPQQTKRKLSSTQSLGEPEPGAKSSDSDSDVALQTWQRTKRSPSQPAARPSRKRKRKRTRDMLSGHKHHTISPESQSEAESESPEPASATSPHKPIMLRELKAHNESPEQDLELEEDILRDSMQEQFFTRSARRKAVSFLTNKTPTPPKDLNVTRLMLTEFSGKRKGTKTFSFDSSSKPGPSPQRRQPDSWPEMDVDVDDGEEGISLNDSRRDTTSRSEQRSPHRTNLLRLRESSASDEQDQDVVVESPWSAWDSQKGQLLFTTTLYHKTSI